MECWGEVGVRNEDGAMFGEENKGQEANLSVKKRKEKKDKKKEREGKPKKMKRVCLGVCGSREMDGE